MNAKKSEIARLTQEEVSMALEGLLSFEGSPKPTLPPPLKVISWEIVLDIDPAFFPELVEKR